MIKLFVILLLSIAAQSLGDSVTDGTKLIGTLLVHRHGDRTQGSSSAVVFTTDPDAVEAASAQYGYGQLTNQGKQRAYRLGETIRARYGELLSPQYNKSEIYIRSTEYTRAKMTVLTAMAAVYPSYPGSWSDEINWVPTPFTTVPAKYDYMLYTVNCPNYLAAYSTLIYGNSDSMTQYFDVLNVVSAASGYNITEMPVMAYTFFDVYYSQINMGIALSDEIAAIMPELQEAAGAAAEIFLADTDYIAMEAGVVLNDFFTYSDELIAGTDTPPVRIYSAHDVNVYAYEAAAKVTTKQGYPEYASYFALELRQVEETGQYVVLPVYQATPGDEVVYLSVDGCDSLLCDYDTYKEIVAEYTLDEDSWRTACGFTDDLVVDESSIA